MRVRRQESSFDIELRSRFRFVRVYPSQDLFTQERYNQLLRIAFTTLTPHISDEFVKFLDMAYDYRISVRFSPFPLPLPLLLSESLVCVR